MAKPKPTRAKPAYVPDPRVLKARQVAFRLNMSETTFGQKRPMLEASGFPRRNKLIDGWDADAIERWLDALSGIGGGANDDEIMGGVYDR